MFYLHANFSDWFHLRGKSSKTFDILSLKALIFKFSFLGFVGSCGSAANPPPSALGALLTLNFCLVNHLSVRLNKGLLSTAYARNCCNCIDQTSTILSILCPQPKLMPIIIYRITCTGFLNVCEFLYMNRNVCFEAPVCHTFPLFGVSGLRKVCWQRL